MPRLYTIGHSTRPLSEFVDLLRAFSIERLVDVRTVPRSRRHPQFGRDELPHHLEGVGITYEHSPFLGGLRKPRADSANTAWRNESFRGYADHMQGPEFAAAVDALVAGATALTAIMCAEAVPWRCHRSLIADALLVRGVEVLHIMTPTRADAHEMTRFAVVEGGQVTYPAREQGSLW